MSSFVKDPAAVLDYAFDWTAWLADAETISDHTVTVPDGIVLGATTSAGGVVTVWLSGGTNGDNYRVTCQIVTDQGRTDERTFTLAVRDR